MYVYSDLKIMLLYDIYRYIQCYSKVSICFFLNTIAVLVPNFCKNHVKTSFFDRIRKHLSRKRRVMKIKLYFVNKVTEEVIGSKKSVHVHGQILSGWGRSKMLKH